MLKMDKYYELHLKFIETLEGFWWAELRGQLFQLLFTTSPDKKNPSAFEGAGEALLCSVRVLKSSNNITATGRTGKELQPGGERCRRLKSDIDFMIIM